MSSKQNDTNNHIHLGNYEEYFILYMDNELAPSQMKLVDEFLVSHPDLRGEFELLASIKLPSEEMSFNKEELFSDALKSSSINEDLLLYIDDELDPESIKFVETELASNKDYRLQHELLLQTKLDPSEEISYPNKKELFKRTVRVLAFRPWMKIAAAIIILAVMSVFYFRKTSLTTTETGGDNNIVNREDQIKTIDKSSAPQLAVPDEKVVGEIADVNNQTKKTVQNSNIKDDNQVAKDEAKKKKLLHVDIQNNQIVIRENDPVEKSSLKRETTIIETKGMNTTTTGSQDISNKVFLNKPDVTYTDPGTYNKPDDLTESTEGSIASNDKKRSVKGFLRKATRLIEKKTGFDPTNDDGQLLIGMVAVKLK